MQTTYFVLSVILFVCSCLCTIQSNGQDSTKPVDVGVILDLDTYVGKMSKTSIEMAVEDFYGARENYTTRLVLHIVDSKNDPVEATTAAIELLKSYQVKAILGPQQSRQADFVAEIGVKTRVPIISFTATSPSVSHIETPYFIRMAQPDTSQLLAIASIATSFNWRQLVPIYETTDYGSGVITYLSDTLQSVGTRVPYRCGISPSATDDQILKELYKLMTMQTRVFLVHMMPSLASRVFLLAKKAGMMSKGYAWVITDGIAGILRTMNQSVIESMQGIIGLKPFIADSVELSQFSVRWKQKFSQENPGTSQIQLNAFGLWAYDSVSVLAEAVEHSNIADSEFQKPDTRNNNLTDIQAIGVFQSGPKLLRSIQSIKLEGLGGKVNLINGELPISSFQVINLVGNESIEIGIWTPKDGIKNGLSQVIWPGKSMVTPKGWEFPVNEKKLKVGVPVKSGFEQFIRAGRDELTNATIVRGYCSEVFETAMEELPFTVLYEYELFEKSDGSGESAGSYDDLVNCLDKQVFDVVVGDVTIRQNRSEYADFTLPYTESGVSMIVPIKGDDRKNAWIFTKPLKMELWITIGVFFVYTGIVIWVLEHRVNKEFRGTPAKQAGMIIWFSFSTMVFAHREKVVSNLSRFVLIIWVFVVLVMTSSYTASLTSLLTVQQLQPTITNINDVILSGGYVGYQDGSFVPSLLATLGVTKLKVLVTPEDYNDALSNGSVSAIVDEVPYLNVVLGKYCSKFRMVGPTYKTAGFGFAFPKGSPLVPEVSRAILKVMESSRMNEITNRWFWNNSDCSGEDTTTLKSDSLTLDSFKGLFVIAGLSSTLALLIFLINFLYENRHILNSQETTVKQKLVAMARTFDEPKVDLKEEKANEKEEKETEMSDFDCNVSEGFVFDPSGMSPGAISLSQHEEGMFSPDEGFSPAQHEHPAGPHHTYAMTRATEDRY